jgi:hypothetical protein
MRIRPKLRGAEAREQTRDTFGEGIIRREMIARKPIRVRRHGANIVAPLGILWIRASLSKFPSVEPSYRRR